MSTHKIYEYFFKRKPEEWDIIGFLNECHLETKQQLIECYLLSLEEIIVSRKDTRSSVSEKRKFPEINESDPTEIEKSNATSEDNEDVNGDNIINDEQVLDKKGLKKVAKTVIHHSICDAINTIQKILTTSNKVEDENPFLNSHLLKSPTADNIVQDGDYKHPDVCYIRTPLTSNIGVQKSVVKFIVKLNFRSLNS
ncbi:hypothetical protein RhiirA1_436516 [Rhizophagus irregularis]|uniref:Uncharacterized protein n=1 Tax=Rhizophagus irregularis TaxID=588596 RepID=A0A2N0SHJ8_9GLOM|nr:hypothetical protein RhiirA1_436516 [Rhizophagus irregularis]